MTGPHATGALAGRTVIVTRASAQAAGLVRALEALGSAFCFARTRPRLLIAILAHVWVI